MSLQYSKTKKRPFYAITTRRSKSRKINIFPKGLTHGFGPKMTIFPAFFFRQFRPRKCFLRYSRKKKRPFHAIKTRCSNSRIIDIFPKELAHCLIQKWPFFRLIVLEKFGQEKIFYDILERNNAFLGYKNKKFK